MHLGNVEFFVVSDGAALSDGGGMYGLVPRVLWEKVTPPDELNRVPTHLNCLLIKSAGKIILVDTGLGDKLDARGEANFGRTGGSKLLDELARAGVAPCEVDIVINTHLHLDHCGGNTRRENGTIVATFPRAEYWIQRLEWADAAFPNERTRGTYLPENFAPLGEQARLIDGDTRVTNEVRCLITRGHTRAHQSVLIESDGKQALFLGDIAGRAVFLERLAWIPAYDVEPLETLETKRRLREWAIAENILLIFQHEFLLTMGYMRRAGEKWWVEKVE
ncbi:MAG: MBL fold metallo-hydrolase [Chloroflexi bacterium]|nr:MBL fold metallo-hydrolase [Chloroflexota bacterium]